MTSRELESGPLSSVQLRLWLLEELGLGGPSYMIDYALRLRGDISLDSLRRALNTVFQGHDILRTRYRRVGDDPVQVVVREELTVLEKPFVLDDSIPLTDQLWEAARAIERPLDGEEPPCYFQLLKIAADDVIVLMSGPHISLDGASLTVLRDELCALLAADRLGHAPANAKAAGQTYLGYARRQQDRKDAGSADASYWTRRLHGLRTLPMPTDFPRPPRFSGRGYHVEATGPSLVAEKHRFLGKRRGVSAHSVYLALFMLGLARFTGQTDIAVGIPLSDRQDPETRHIVGCFAETVVIRVDVSRYATFGELVMAVRDAVLDAMEHPRLPFHEIVARNGVRDPSSHPVYQVMFSCEEPESDIPPVPGLRVTELTTGVQSAKVDMFMQCAELDDGNFRIWISYPFSLFRPETAEAFAQRLASLARAIVAAPDGSLSGLDRPAVGALPEGHRQNEAGVLGRPLAETAAADPDRPALLTEAGPVSHGDLAAAVAKCAQRFSSRREDDGQVVEISTDDLPEAVVQVLAARAAGRVFRLCGTPRPGAPDSAADSATAGVVGTADGGRHALGDTPAALFTDGRGVSRTLGRRALRNQIRDQARALELAAGEQLLVLSSPVTPGRLIVALAALELGATVAVADPSPHTSGEDPLGALGEVRPVAVHTESAAALRRLAEHGELGRWPALRVICAGEEPLPARVLRQIERQTSARVLGTVRAGANQAHAEIAASSAHVRAGARVLAGRVGQGRIHLLDHDRQPVATGEIGELHLSELSLAGGAALGTALPAERIVAGPFGGRPAGTQPTGLVGRRTPAGSVEILGRRDRRLFLHGVLVDLDEVAAALRTHPSVADAAVDTRKDDEGTLTLAAEVLPRTGGTPISTDQLRDYLGSLLPLPMVPRTLRVAGPGPAPRAVAEEATEVARQLVPQLGEIWAQCLSLDEVGPDTDFFWAGGHSLIASLIIGRISSLYPEVQIPANAVFDRPVFADFAELIARLVAESGGGQPAARAGAPGVFDPLIRLRPGDGPLTVFCAPPAAGVSWCYRALLPFIDGAIPVVGLQSPCPDGASPYHSMAELASDCVTRMRSVQPQGPYLLLGWSFGGTLAQEIAVRLQEDGERTGLLVLIDASPSRGGSTADSDAAIAVAVKEASRSVPGGDAEEVVRMMTAARRQNGSLQRRFTSRYFQGTAHHFEAALETDRPVPLAEEWRPLLGGGVHNYPVNSDHDGMMDTGAVAQLGPILAELISAVRN